MENLIDARRRMLINIYKFLEDDMYVHLMSICYDGYIKALEDGKISFLIDNLHLTPHYQDTIRKLYISIKDDPDKIENEYTNLLKSCIDIINRQHDDFMITYIKLNHVKCTYAVTFQQK